MRKQTSKFLLLLASSGILFQLGGCLIGLAMQTVYTNTLKFVIDEALDAVRGEDDPNDPH